MKKISPFLMLLLLANTAMAQKVTFSGQIANIVYNNCTSCHRTGSIAPFSLENYQDVYNNRFAIKQVVQNKTMPPWTPNPGYTHFANERVLTPEQIGQINEWVNNGAQRGDAAAEPAPPVFNDGPQLANPDFSQTCKPHTVDKPLDDFELFALPSNLTQDAIIKQMELIPGNRKIVHHIFVFVDSTGDFTQFMNDQNVDLNHVSGNNYISGGPMSMVKLVGGWLPGGTYTTMPDNMGFKVPKGSWYILQIHYAPGSEGQTDATTLNIKYTGDMGTRGMTMKPLLDNVVNMVDGPLFVPANSVRTFKEEFVVPNDMSLAYIIPHQHKLGKLLKVYAYDPKTNDTIRLCEDHWDFHWQGIYMFPRLMHIKAGMVLAAEGTYDNTSNNHDNPFYPCQDIAAGTSTLTEMMQVFFGFTDYKPGDENIVLSNMHQPTYDELTSCKVYPNPVMTSEDLNVELDPHVAVNRVNLIGMDGRILGNYIPSYTSNSCTVKLPELNNGVYYLQVSSSQNTTVKKIVVNNMAK